MVKGESSVDVGCNERECGQQSRRGQDSRAPRRRCVPLVLTFRWQEPVAPQALEEKPLSVWHQRPPWAHTRFLALQWPVGC